MSSCLLLGDWLGLNHGGILPFLFLFLDLTFYCLISLFLWPFLFPNKQSIHSSFTVSVFKFGVSSAGTWTIPFLCSIIGGVTETLSALLLSSAARDAWSFLSNLSLSHLLSISECYL